MEKEPAEPTGEPSGWKRIYLITAVLSMAGAGGAGVAEGLRVFGLSLITAVATLGIALVLSLTAILYLVTEQIDSGASG